METLTLNGKKYVKAAKAARDLGYATDYVGQLCRKGAVDAQLVGRTWYVDPDTLGVHRVEKKRNARVKAREHAQRSIAEARAKAVSAGNSGSRRLAISYESDRSPLVPETRKVVVHSEPVRMTAPTPDALGDDQPGYEIENPDKKVVMSGELTVTDAEEEISEDVRTTTVLTPRIMRHHPRREQEDEEPAPSYDPQVEEEAEEERTESGRTQEEEKNSAPVTFLERLNNSAEEGVPEDPRSLAIEPVGVGETEDGVTARVSYFNQLLSVGVVAVILTTVGSLFLISTTHYEGGEVVQDYRFDVPGTVEHMEAIVKMAISRL